jgi:hypothetical protein
MWNNHIRVQMIDVQGFDDLHRTDCEIFLDMAGWMAIAYEKKMYLSGIIYLHRITDGRIKNHYIWNPVRLNLHMFKELCGSKSFSEMTLVSTMWDSVGVGRAEKVTREHNLTANEQFWEPMVKQGSRVARHSNSRDSAMSIIDSIVKRQRTIVLEIQDEMVNRRLRLDETEAGKFMSRQLLDQRNKLQQEIRNLQDEMQEYVATKDDDEARNIAELLELSQERIDRLDQEVRDLRVSSENLKWEREQEFEKILDEMSLRVTK